MGAVNQALTCIEARGGAPHTPEDRKPPAVKATPRPLPKTNPLPAPSAPLVAWANPTKAPPAFAQPTPVQAPQEAILPLHLCLSDSVPPKEDRKQSPPMAHADVGMGTFKSTNVPYRSGGPVVPPNEHEGCSRSLGSPHLDQLGSHRALIQTVDKFRTDFLAAFGNPNATQAAERQITHLTQTGTCAEYITKFRTIAMDLDWNNAALCGQFARGLHWEVSRLIATQERRPTTLLELQNTALVINNALQEERASHPRGNKPGTSTTTPNRGQVPANRPRDRDAFPAIPTLSPRRNKTAAGLKAYASNAANWATNLQNAALAGKPHPRRKVRHLIFPAPLHHGSTPPPSHRSPFTPHRYYAQWVEPQAGKIWKKANLTFSLDGRRITETFLICNTGSHAAILGLKWLEAHNPEIDWNQRTLSFPHALPECVAIAKEEEADQNPLKGVPSKYHQYAKVFGEEEFNKLPLHRHYDIGIELTKEGPLNSPLYSMTNAKSATLKDWLRDKLKAGKIRPSKSSISSPVMFVPKKDGSRQLVVDYCCLNNRTKKNVYLLPRPDNLMAQLCGAKVFTKLDLRWGYDNVRVKEGDEWKTAFQTKYGLYKSLVMTFGLTNAPAAFQHFMNKLFKDLLDVCVIIYLDNILVYSKDDASHTQHVHEVLQRLMENQLFCKASKCTFHVSSVEYLGIIVSDKGFSLDKLKIQAVQEWPVPTKVKEVQLFLGFANFLCCFVANFSHMARPLHNLVKKDMPWKWDTKEQEAFQGLKDAITNAPVLCHADPTKPYFLETDALGAALGSILSQRQEDGRLHPLGFLSKSFKGAKQNYNTHDKELLAIICSFEYWRIFLEGTAHPVTIFTITATWTGYNFQIIYRPGKQLGKPDALSRRSDHVNIPPAAQTMLPDPVFANIALITPEKELQRQIELSLDQDKSWKKSYSSYRTTPKLHLPSNTHLRITKWKQAYCSIKDALWFLMQAP
ncbi:hypothetical protein RHS01_07839 [Rhizoctonia solani]|uniref:Reverse transcriptase domain-containing protein n=1 Tax=Rhizoctonia solani TaxID=456999 RepID=A0A8H7M2P2_9AGAM|nr:hypothetical protein RHS01_07839 [Rhizoctonia solani]